MKPLAAEQFPAEWAILSALAILRPFSLARANQMRSAG